MPWDFLVIANPVWETARLVERIPDDADLDASLAAPGDGDAGDAVVSDGGGSALNTACALAMAGRRVLAVGRVGDDTPGRACLEALKRRGIETACEILPGRTTKRNTCFVERETHATAFGVELPARSVPPWEETPDALLEARILLLDRLAATAPAWLQARSRALARGRDQASDPANHDRGWAEAGDHAGIARDTAGRHAETINAFVRNSAILSPVGQARFAAALPHLEYLQVPEDAGLGDTAPDSARLEPGRIHRPRAMPPLAPEEIAAIFAAGVRILVRTRGARGVVVHTAKRPVELSAVPTDVIDPTGAGDAFAAGTLHALLDGLTPADSARRGLDWAARACRYLGARGWLDHEPPR